VPGSDPCSNQGVGSAGIWECLFCVSLTALFIYFFFRGICGASVHRIQNCEWWNHMCRFYHYLLLYRGGGGHARAHLNHLVARCRCVVQYDLSPICFVVYPIQICLPLWNACFVTNTVLHYTFVACRDILCRIAVVSLHSLTFLIILFLGVCKW